MIPVQKGLLFISNVEASFEQFWKASDKPWTYKTYIVNKK